MKLSEYLATDSDPTVAQIGRELSEVERCADCHGPMVQAFPESTLYLRCQRCGHVRGT